MPIHFHLAGYGGAKAAVRRVNQILTELGLDKAPNKTFIGRITKGFTWLGYPIGPDGLRLAPATWERFAARIRQLYEQRADETRMGVYVQHWWRWARAGLGGALSRELGRPGAVALCVLSGNLGVVLRRMTEK